MPDRAARAHTAGVLPVGSPGKVGVLDLEYRVVPGGRTVLTDRYQKTPLQVMRPLYIDPFLPDVPVTYLMSTGGGVVDGDRLDIGVDLADGAHAVLTTQACTRVHRMDVGYATQDVRLRLGAGAICEWLPDPLIPYAGSRFQQRLHATVPTDAVLVAADVLTAGRVARGERWSMDAAVSTVELYRPDGTPLVVDTTRMVGAEGTNPLVTGDAVAVGTLFVLAATPPVELAETLRGAGGRDAGVRCGVSTLPDGCGAWMRILGDTQEGVEAAVRRAWSAARLHVLGVPAPDLRKC